MPDTPITVVVRSDASGTSFNFTSHLAAISDDFKDGPGAGTSVQWPSSDKIIKAPKNDGVTATILQTPGAIGYVEYGYAKLTGTPMATLENKAGKFVAAGGEGGAAALASAEFDDQHARLHHRSRGRGRLPDRDLHLDALLQGRPGSGEGRGDQADGRVRPDRRPGDGREPRLHPDAGRGDREGPRGGRRGSAPAPDAGASPKHRAGATGAAPAFDGGDAADERH